MKNLIQILKERDFIDSITDEVLVSILDTSMGVYIGFDPTAESLHLGNLVGIIALEWFRRFGYKVVALIGGATGKIGDPSGKSQERPLLSEEAININVEKCKNQLKKCLGDSVKILDNASWYGNMSIIHFLRDVGKHFRIGTMLGKESVRSRMQSEEGMSFTEFSYQLLQAHDFNYLCDQENVTLQLGGSDQWGNIVAGIDLTRKLLGKNVYGLTFPLLTRSDGKKFGKTEEGAIWLSPQLCSPYHFYQYLFRIPDADVGRMMRMLTFIELSEIEHYEKKLKEGMHTANEAQKRLAEEVTRFVHGEEGLSLAIKITEGISPGSKAELDIKMLEALAGKMPTVTLKKQDVLGASFADLAVKGGLLASKGEANRLIKNGGAYLNDQKVTNLDFCLEENQIIGDKYILIGAGKKKKLLIQIESL